MNLLATCLLMCCAIQSPLVPVLASPATPAVAIGDQDRITEVTKSGATAVRVRLEAKKAFRLECQSPKGVHVAVRVYRDDKCTDLIATWDSKSHPQRDAAGNIKYVEFEGKQRLVGAPIVFRPDSEYVYVDGFEYLTEFDPKTKLKPQTRGFSETHWNRINSLHASMAWGSPHVNAEVKFHGE
jgi:hypothetical protein